MFKKTILFALAVVMALAMIISGCGMSGKSSIVMDTSDEKMAVIEFNNAKEDEFVQGGYLSVAEGEGIEVVSDLNDSGKVLIGFIAVPEDQNIDELPDMDSTKYEMMISGNATQGATFDPGAGRLADIGWFLSGFWPFLADRRLWEHIMFFYICTIEQQK